jgi:hypothetical protein
MSDGTVVCHPLFFGAVPTGSIESDLIDFIRLIWISR